MLDALTGPHHRRLPVLTMTLWLPAAFQSVSARVEMMVPGNSTTLSKR